MNDDISRIFKGKKAFIPFITVGDPDIGTSRKLIEVMAKEGASLIELGIPFSDPVAEGVVIQDANRRALESGVTTEDVFLLVESLRNDGIDVPLAIMTYANVVFSYGTEAFLSKMNSLRIAALILPDVPYEEKDEFSIPASRYGISLISMIAPTSNDRISMIAKDADGFIYCVSSLGVTGIRENFSSNIEDVVKSIRTVRPDLPIAIGFGISDARRAKAMADLSDGVIIGSAIVNIIAKYKNDSIEPVRSFVRDIVKAIR